MLVDSLSQQYQTHEVPIKYLEKWQQLADVIAEIFDIPAALIMRVEPEQISVLIASNSEGNPYKPDEKANLNTGLYCETVMFNRSALEVPHALEDSEWAENPDVALNMNYYLGYPLFWPNGEVFGTICVLDSKKRTFGDAYKNLLAQFKDMIETDFQLIHQNEKLIRAIKDLDSFAYTVSHDLKAPLHMVDMFLERIDIEKDQIKSESICNLLGRINKKIYEMNGLINDILIFSRSSSKDINKRDINLSTLIEARLTEASEEYPERSFDFSVQPECFAHTDQDLINIVIANLVENALKFTGKKEKAEISFGRDTLQGKEVYFLKDNGIGFEPEHAEEIFEPFVRLVSSSAFEGTGIGLATTSRIIERLGGRIWTESQEGVGTTFFFTLGK